MSARFFFKTNKSFYFSFSVFQETWYKFIDFSFPSEEVMGPNFWRKFFFLPWLIRMFPQHWRTFKYTLMIAVNVVLQVRTHCCVLTGNCPMKITIIVNYVPQWCVWTGTYLKKITIWMITKFYVDDRRKFCSTMMYFYSTLSGEDYNYLHISSYVPNYIMVHCDKNLSKKDYIYVDDSVVQTLHIGAFW